MDAHEPEWNHDGFHLVSVTAEEEVHTKTIMRPWWILIVLPRWPVVGHDGSKLRENYEHKIYERRWSPTRRSARSSYWLTETSRHETDQHRNDTSSDMAFVLHSEKCASVLWQWFCWWSGVALGHQGINVMSTSWTYPKFCTPMVTNTSMPSMFNIRGFASFFKVFFRRPNLNTKPKFEQCSCSLANLNWVLGLFPIDLVKVIGFPMPNSKKWTRVRLM